MGDRLGPDRAFGLYLYLDAQSCHLGCRKGTVELPQAGSIRVPGVLEGSEEGLYIGASVTGNIRPADEKTKNYATMVWRLADEKASK